MSDGTSKYTDAKVRDIVENEGLGYAVQFYMNSDDIKSAKTAALWDAAQSAMKALAAHLGVEE